MLNVLFEDAWSFVHNELFVLETKKENFFVQINTEDSGWKLLTQSML